MVEKIVLDIAEWLLRKITSFAYQEVSRAYSVYEDLPGIKDTITIVRCLLLDGEKKDREPTAHVA
jgi:hypothetical protein